MLLSSRDYTRLKGVNPNLVEVVEKAAQITDIQFTVGEGVRSKQRQQQMVAEGKSQTMNSKHLTGDAVDLYPLTNDRTKIDSTGYDRLAAIMKKASFLTGVPIEWGGDWKSFIDKPHYQVAGEKKNDWDLLLPVARLLFWQLQ